jgi:hypothetical protein
LPKLREIGFRTNRRMLEVERLSYDCILAEDTFQRINMARSSRLASAPLDCALPIPAPMLYGMP